MVAIAVVLTLLICVLVDKFLRRDIGGEIVDTAPSVALRPLLEPAIWVGGFRFQHELSYHLGHAWAWPERAGVVRLGSDEFTGRLLGSIDGVDLPPLGTVLRQGDRAWCLRRAGRCVPILAPLGGRVIAANEQLCGDPDLVRCDPYGEGWLVAVVPHDLRGDLNNLLRGDLARYWLEGCAAEMRAYACRSGHLSIVDGGAVSGDLREILSEAEWIVSIRHLLRTDLG